MTAQPTGRRGTSGLSLRAPPPGLPFPDHANLTAAELLAFLPNSLKCADIVYRFMSNTGTRKTIYTMVNTFRDLEVEWSANCCGSLMYKTMEGAGYRGWTIKKHDDWHAERKADWDSNNLDVGRFQTPGSSDQGISFKSLAVDVRTMPDGDDALDLTRMVRHCVENPAEAWTYPGDYGKLLNMLGGAAQPKKENTDVAVFGRWEGRNPSPPNIRPAHPEVKKEEPLEKRPQTANQRREKTTAAHSRPESELMSGTSASAGQPEAPKLERHMTQTRAGSVAELDDSDTDGEEWGRSKPYTRQQPEYVAPPGDAVEPSEQSVLLAFEHGGATRQTNPYSAYAFGGPRDTPPYRLLHQISQPHPCDTSAWAENLRWEFEQRALFAHNGTKRWNESPEHLARIELERTTRIWASDELQHALLD